MSNWAEQIAGGLAVKFLERQLKQGKSIEIPSLGITISASDTNFYEDEPSLIEPEYTSSCIPIGTTSCGYFKWDGTKWIGKNEKGWDKL